MANEDLFKSLQMLQQGIGQYKTTQALNEANDLVSQINMQATGEAEKRAQVQKVAQGLAQQMLAAGNDPAHTTAGAQTVDPLYGSYADLAKIGLTAQASAQAKAAEKKPLPVSAVDKIQKIDDQLIQGEDLINQAVSDPSLTGIINGRIPMREWASPKFASFKAQSGRFFDAYRVAITGAGATDTERKDLQQNTPVITDPPKVYQAKMMKFLETGRRIRARYIRNLGKSGRDTSEFEEPEGAPAAGGGPDISKYLK